MLRGQEELTSMPIMPQTPKSVGSLTLADLAAFPIWEWADDEEGLEDRDETWVRPVDTRTVPKGSYTLVAVGFRAACGREFEGNISVSRLEETTEFFNGVIFQGADFYLIPNPELAFFEQAMTELLKGLGLSESELFPITFALRVPFDGEPNCRRGMLEGRKADMTQPGRPDQGQMTFW
jgi:hypothetical protein